MNTLSETYKVQTFETDSNSRLNIQTLAGFVQQVSYNHSEELGFGFSHLREQNFFWALSRFYFQMERMPLWGEEFIIKTWHKGYDSVMAMRDYTFHTKTGEYLGAAASDWLIVDIAARRIQRAEQICGTEHLHTEDAIPGKKLNKLKPVEGLVPAMVVYPRFSHIDVNNHVNNAIYYTWALDYLPVDMRNAEIRNIEINFLSEAKFNEPIEIAYAQVDDNTWYCSMKNKDSGVEHARLQIALSFSV